MVLGFMKADNERATFVREKNEWKCHIITWDNLYNICYIVTMYVSRLDK